MSTERRLPADDLLLRTAARRTAWQIVGAITVVVIVAGVIALLIVTSVHHRDGPGQHDLGPDHDDDLILTTLLIAGGVAIGVAGLASFLIARRAVVPLGTAMSLQRRFVADAGHELRTPLTVLHTRAQLIARRMADDDPARPAVEQLLDDSRVLGQIIDDLLTSAQLAADPTSGERVELGLIVDRVVTSLRVLGTERRVELAVHHLPGTSIVRGSSTALRRAITALVDNGLEHAPSEGHVVVTTARDGDDVVITVIDDGPGLGDEDPGRLVERFARGSRTAPGRRSFGLGLSLVQEIARSHGGSFTLADRPAGGAVATLRIPAG